MIKRQQFKNLRENNNTLEKISELMFVNIRTCKRWNKELKVKKLIRNHRLVNKVSNFRSGINKKKILEDYLHLAKIIACDKKAQPYNFEYYVRHKLIDKCSIGTFKLIMRDNYIASPWARKATKKEYKSILNAMSKNKRLCKDKIREIQTIIKLNEKIYFRKPRTEYEGEIGEIDACKDYWIGTLQSHLHGCYDPATRSINALHLEKEETTHGYNKMLEILLIDGKVPEMFKRDCRSTFIINKKNAGALAHKDINTQFGFTLNVLGVKMENSSEPTFKGAIERFFRTAQNQLKGEFRERDINTFEEANIFLKKYMIQFNNQYSIKALKKHKKFLKRELTSEEINELLSVRSFRKTDKANSISYKNELLSLYDQNNNRVSFKEKSAVLILETLNGMRIAKYMGETLILKSTDYAYLTSSQVDQYKNLRRLTPNFSSPDYHPWGYKVFMMYLQKTNNLNRYLKK